MIFSMPIPTARVRPQLFHRILPRAPVRVEPEISPRYIETGRRVVSDPAGEFPGTNGVAAAARAPTAVELAASASIRTSTAAFKSLGFSAIALLDEQGSA